MVNIAMTPMVARHALRSLLVQAGLVALLSLGLAASTARAQVAPLHDWRVPSIKKLFTLVELCASNPAINTIVFPSTIQKAPNNNLVVALGSIQCTLISSGAFESTIGPGRLFQSSLVC